MLENERRDSYGARFIFRSAGRLPALLSTGVTFPVALLALSQATDLFYVVQAVDEMKLSPLRGREGPEDRMVQEFAARPKLFLAAREVGIHFGDFLANLSENLLWRQSSRTGYCGGFPSGGHVSELNDD